MTLLRELIEIPEHVRKGDFVLRLSEGVIDLKGMELSLTRDPRRYRLLEAAHVVQEYGAQVLMLFAVVDRGGTVSAMAADEGIAFDALYTSQDLGFTNEEA